MYHTLQDGMVHNNQFNCVSIGDVFLAARDELEPLVTHRLPIREAGKAFTLYERHEDDIIKALIDMSDW